jgi:hypothetical protein
MFEKYIFERYESLPVSLMPDFLFIFLKKLNISETFTGRI